MTRLLFLLPVLLVMACKQQNANKANDYYASLYLPYTDVKVKQQQFIDSASSVLAKLFVDSSITINTAGLHVLLDTLEQACQAGESVLFSVSEIDTSIRYKSKVLEYAAFSSMACKGEFKEMLNILEAKTLNRYDSIMKFLGPVTEDLKRKNNECAKTGEAFRVKYNIAEK